MSKCRIVGENTINELVVKYLGGAKDNISRTEMEILMFALVNESKERGGIAAQGYALMDARLKRQSLVVGGAQ